MTVMEHRTADHSTATAPEAALVRLPRDRRRVALASAFGAGVLAITGAGVYAALSATATNTTPQEVESGTLSLTMADGSGAASFTGAIAGLAPGDAVRRHVDLVNGGDVEGRQLGLSVTPSASNALSAALSVAVRGCSVAWDAAAGTCGGTEAVLLPSTPLAGLATRTGLAEDTLAGGATRHLQVEVALADVVETVINGALPDGTVQGLTTGLTYEFGVVQREATTSSS